LKDDLARVPVWVRLYNQLAIKAKDSLEKKKKGSKASSKKNKKSGSSPGGTSR